jgi:predicted small lipoprotein YifL
MVVVHILSHRRPVALLGLGVCALLILASCGQRGALYMPDRNASVVTHAGASAPSSAASSAPASAPSQVPAAEPH